MHPKSNDRRILAIALRSRRFGFAVFEGPNRLLDWGIVKGRVKPGHCGGVKLDQLVAAKLLDLRGRRGSGA
jgi:hypothetical protein